MKRIEFVAPVEAMRGNLSGNQNLVYPLSNNAAFDAPSGRRSYARNYGTRYIGAKRASTGLKYFGVKTKSAVYLSTKTRMVMALLGGTGAVRAKLMKETAFYENTLVKAFEYARTSGAIESSVTIDKWLFDLIYEVLKAKSPVFIFKTALSASSMRKNPWVESNAAASGINIGMAILVKFWPQLANNPIVKTIDGRKLVAHVGDTFQDIIDSDYNVLALSKITSGGSDYVVSDGDYVQGKNVDDPETEWSYETVDTEIADSAAYEYRFISDAPSA